MVTFHYHDSMESLTIIDSYQGKSKLLAYSNGRLPTDKSIYSQIMEDKIQIQDQFTGKLLNRILRLIFADRHCPQTVPPQCPSTMSSDYAGGPCTNAFISYAFISIL